MERSKDLNSFPFFKEGGGNGKILILSLSLRKGEDGVLCHPESRACRGAKDPVV